MMPGAHNFRRASGLSDVTDALDSLGSDLTADSTTEVSTPLLVADGAVFGLALLLMGGRKVKSEVKSMGRRRRAAKRRRLTEKYQEKLSRL